MSAKIISTTVYNRHIVALISDNSLEYVRVLSAQKSYSIGTVAVGRVVKMLPATGACFVDIGDKENYYVKIPNSINEITFVDSRTHSKLQCEDQILIQISKEAVKTKAPSATTQISLSGKYVVLEEGKGLAVSKKLSEAERKTLLLPEDIDLYAKSYHVIVRTQASEAKFVDDISKELMDLAKCFDEIKRKANFANDRTVVYEPETPLISSINELSRFSPEEYITDLYEDFELVSNQADLIPSRLYSDDNLPLAKLYKLETYIDETLAKRVYMKSGAFLVVEQGETLTSIDVNSAHVISGDKEETAYKINCEAANEIGHILRTRNISGMILIDFINMKNPKNELALISLIKEVISRDSIKTNFIDITGLGLVELTRQRTISSFIEQWKD